MVRPYFNKSIVELEKLFADAQAAKNLGAIRLVSDEVKERSTSRAKALKKRVEQSLQDQPLSPPMEAINSRPAIKGSAKPVVAKPTPAPSPMPQQSRVSGPPQTGLAPQETVSKPPDLPKRQPLDEVVVETLAPPRPPNRESPRRPPNARRSAIETPVAPALSADQAARLVSGWTAIEVLSPPQTFKRPADLADGDFRRVAEITNEGPLPWQRGEKSRPQRQLFYQVVLGTIRMNDATERLLEVFEDQDVERLPPIGRAPIAIITLDRTGLPVGEPAVAISSFAWGLPIALARNLQALDDWPNVEAKLLEEIDKHIRRADADTGELLPLDRKTISGAFERLVGLLKLPSDLVDPPHFAIRVYHWWKAEDPPDPPPMGSFFLADLARVKNLVSTKSAPSCLRRYLGMEKPSRCLDLLCDDALLSEVVAPSATPASRWPVKGGHPLVTLQQAAVNLATNGSDTTRLLPVNGPPGTGKTTLLRDLVASVVLQRAQHMVEFDDPSSAFNHTAKAKLDGAFAHIYKIDERLKGFEIVVASSNNKAVENVSKELPLLGAIAEDCSLRYFPGTADLVSRGIGTAVADTEAEQQDLFGSDKPPPLAWGLVAAALGNARNRYAFRQAAWGHDDYGLRRYLLEAAGVPQIFELKDPKTGRIAERRKPQIVIQEKPPKNEEDAKKRWKAARSRFRRAFDTVTKRLATLEEGRLALSRSGDHAAVTSAQKVMDNLLGDLRRQKATVVAAEPEVAKATQRVKDIDSALRAHAIKKPGLLSKLFSSTEASEWRREFDSLEASASSAHQRDQEAGALLQGLRNKVVETEYLLGKARKLLDAARSQIESQQIKISDAEALCESRFGDAAFFERDRSDTHRDTPWLDNQTNALRADLFVAAMQVHRAFIDAAAKPIRNNLDMLFRTFFGRSAWNEKVRPLLPDLWATFHCVVPVVSTTFASVERMLGPLPTESIGWLLLDEAGQASPQHAVGALMRAKRAIVVGDPLQLEPVTSLPSELARGVAKEFRIDADVFLAPEASVQSLADAASQYGTTINPDGEAVRLGVPLIVHRRCAEPMFSLANKVAYAGLMVNGRGKRSSSIRSILGPSRWIDVRPERCDDKWSENEWYALKKLIEQLAANNLAEADFYAISPFRIVAQRLRERVAGMPELRRWTPDPRKWVEEHIGTIHTVQGREADTVFIVLGAAEIAREGARRWAGSKPNLLNVAVTRAKENIYVIGSRYAWASAGVFSELEVRLPPS